MASGGLLSPSQVHHEAGGGQGHVLPWTYNLEVGDSVLALTFWVTFMPFWFPHLYSADDNPCPPHEVVLRIQSWPRCKYVVDYKWEGLLCSFLGFRTYLHPRPWPGPFLAF